MSMLVNIGIVVTYLEFIVLPLTEFCINYVGLLT